MLPVRALLVQRKDGRAYLSPSEEFVWAMMAIHISVRGHAIYQTSIIKSLSFLIDERSAKVKFRKKDRCHLSI